MWLNSYGVECMIGCMLESKLSVSAAAHLCCGRSVITKADLDGPSLCSVDPFTGGPVFEEALVTMPDAPGVGLSAIPLRTLELTPDFESTPKHISSRGRGTPSLVDTPPPRG